MNEEKKDIISVFNHEKSEKEKKNQNEDSFKNDFNEETSTGIVITQSVQIKQDLMKLKELFQSELNEIKKTNNKFYNKSQIYEYIKEEENEKINNEYEIDSNDKINLNEIPINLKQNIFSLIKHKQKIALSSVEDNDNLYQFIISIYLTFQYSLPKSEQILFCSDKLTFNNLNDFFYRALLLKNENILFSIIEIELLPINLQNYLLYFLNNFNNPCSFCFISIEKYSYIFNKLSERENVYKIKSIEILDIKSINTIIKINNLLNTMKVLGDKEGNGKTYNIIKYKKDDFFYINIPIQDSIDMDDIIKKLSSINENINKDTKFKIHLNIHCGINDLHYLNRLLFSLIFMHSINIDDFIFNFSNDDKKDLILMEIPYELDIKKILILPFITEEINCTFNKNLFQIPNEDINDLNFKHLIYLLNYLNYASEKILNDEDVNPENKNWKNTFSNEEAIKLLNNYIIKYDTKNTMTFRKLWIYIHIMGSRLIDFSEANDIQVSSLKKINFDPIFRVTIFEGILLSCEQFSMSKDIISWRNMSNKFFQLFHKNFPISTVYETKDAISELFITYHEKINNDKLFQYNEKNQTDLENFLLEYDGSKFLKNYNIKDYLEIGKDYVLTPDNFLKIILIIQKMKANVPIILIGETGCGKTSMVRYLIEYIKKEKLRILNVHAGITDKYIIDFINESIEETEKNENKNVWIFFDEINTCNYLDLLSEIFCEHQMKGKILPKNLLFIAACNPYIKNSNNLFIKVGINLDKFYSRRTLIYQVNKLPKRFDKFIWEYGKLTDIEAIKYILSMLKKLDFQDKQNLDLEKITNLLFQSHKFINQNQPEYRISLRDIHRFKQIYLFFVDFFNEIVGIKEDFKKTQSVIFSLYMNYYIKLSTNILRKKYFELINSSLDLNENLEELIESFKELIISNLNIPYFYAKNTALIENIFCIFFSIIMKIPLIICGKPGNSKTLSVQLIVENFKGQNSNITFLKNYPKLIPIYYQGSETSTSEGIKELFIEAKKIYLKNKNETILPLIIFDEIGLAEISQNNPLKILHSLFDYELNSQMGFIGITNWALDASKLSRVLYLARPDPDLNDLNLIGLTLFSSFNKILNS